MLTSADFPQAPAEPQPDFRALFESLPGLYLILTPELRIVAVSNSYARATKTVREQIIGQHLFDVFPDNPNDPNASGVRNLKASLERVLQNNFPDTMAVQQYDIRRPESEGGGFEQRYWSPVNSAAIGKDGNVEYLIHRVEDVTDFVLLKQKRAEELKASEELRAVVSQLETELYLRARELDSANQNLRDANRELARLYEKALEGDQLKSQFFANVSHELRTPLTLLLSPVEELLKNPDASVPVSRSDLELMRRNSLRLLRMVNTIFDISRIEAGRLRGEYAPTDLRALTGDCASLFQSAAETTGLWFRMDLHPLGEVLYVDRSMWEKIVLNLLSNAFKFTLQGGITIALRRVGDCAQLSVTDTGIGIPGEELPHIFETFHRAKGTRGRAFEGTGIGLALAAELVKMHGGTMTVRSVPNQGTTFTVSIPFGKAHLPIAQILPGDAGVTPTAWSAYAAEAEVWDIHRESGSGADTAVSETGKERGGSAGEDRPHIVFADDNADVRAYMTRLLGGDYDLEAVSNGAQALAAINRRCPELVLSDVVMPVMDGFQLLQALRRDPRTHAVTVILLSARTEDDSRLEGLEAGADDYLFKPFTARELRARLTSHIRLARLRKEVEQRLHRLNSDLEQRIQDRTASLLASEELLRESEATIRTLLETAAQAILAVDCDGKVVLANQMTEKMFGYGYHELLGMPLETLVPERLRTRHLSHRAEFAASPRSRPMGIGLDLQGLRKDGTEFPIEVSLSTVATNRGALAVGFVTDITMRQQAEASLRNSEKELRALARSLLTAQEDERRRVARDLHDDVTQRLALLSIEIGKLAAGSPSSVSKIETQLRSFQSQTLGVSNEVRRLSHGLHPSVIEDFGLSIALEEFCDEFAKAHGIKLRFDGPADDEGLSAEGASCLYRIAQECLRNAAKHARATEVSVELTTGIANMQLVVRDNGAGFRVEADYTNSGLGLVSMKERMRMANGTLSITSQPGQGTQIVASIPLSGVDS